MLCLLRMAFRIGKRHSKCRGQMIGKANGAAFATPNVAPRKATSRMSDCQCSQLSRIQKVPKAPIKFPIPNTTYPGTLSGK